MSVCLIAKFRQSVRSCRSGLRNSVRSLVDDSLVPACNPVGRKRSKLQNLCQAAERKAKMVLRNKLFRKYVIGVFMTVTLSSGHPNAVCTISPSSAITPNFRVADRRRLSSVAKFLFCLLSSRDNFAHISNTCNSGKAFVC